MELFTENKFDEKTKQGCIFFNEEIMSADFNNYKLKMVQIIESAYAKMEQSIKSEAGNNASIKIKIGQPLHLTQAQMTECVDFVAKKAIILYQSDYSLMRLIIPSFNNIEPTKADAKNAREIAHGFGIQNRHIIDIHNMTVKLANDVFNNVKKEFKAHSQASKRTFLFVYCAGHGVAD